MKPATPTPTPGQSRLAELEQIISSGLSHWINVGQALAEIRDQQLYRTVSPTFAEYVTGRFGFSARRAYYLIAGVKEAEAQVATFVNQTSQSAGTDLTAVLDDLPDESHKAIQQTFNGRRPKRRKKASKPKAIRLRVPGAIVIIEPRKHDADLFAIMRHAVEQLGERANGNDRESPSVPLRQAG